MSEENSTDIGSDSHDYDLENIYNEDRDTLNSSGENEYRNSTISEVINSSTEKPLAKNKSKRFRFLRNRSSAESKSGANIQIDLQNIYNKDRDALNSSGENEYRNATICDVINSPPEKPLTKAKSKRLQFLRSLSISQNKSDSEVQLENVYDEDRDALNSSGENEYRNAIISEVINSSTEKPRTNGRKKSFSAQNKSGPEFDFESVYNEDRDALNSSGENELSNNSVEKQMPNTHAPTNQSSAPLKSGTNNAKLSILNRAISLTLFQNAKEEIKTDNETLDHTSDHDVQNHQNGLNKPRLQIALKKLFPHGVVTSINETSTNTKNGINSNNSAIDVQLLDGTVVPPSFPGMKDEMSFFNLVTTVQNCITEVTHTMETLNKYHHERSAFYKKENSNICNTVHEDESIHQLDIGKLVRDTNASIASSKNLIDLMEKDTFRLKVTTTNTFEEQEVRVREALHKQLTRKFCQVIQEYYELELHEAREMGNRLHELNKSKPDNNNKVKSIRNEAPPPAATLLTRVLSLRRKSNQPIDVGEGVDYQPIDNQDQPVTDIEMQTVSHDDVKLIINSNPPPNNPMQDFFHQVESIQSNIVEIKEVTAQIISIGLLVNQASTIEEEENYSQELPNIVKRTSIIANSVKKTLNEMRLTSETLKLENISNNIKYLSPEMRIRENLIQTLTRKFVDVMKDYQNAQSRYKIDIKKKVKRQVQIIKPDVTYDEVELILKSNNGSSALCRNLILQGEAADAIQHAYIDTNTKYRDILTLEKSMNELHQLFLDFAGIIDHQGEMLDNIDYQLSQAGDYVEESNAYLKEAVSMQKNNVKMKFCICLVILFVIVIIVASVTSSFAKL